GTVAVGRQLSCVAGRAWAAGLSDAHGRRRHDYGAGPVLGGGNDLGGGRGVAWLDRALRGTAGALQGLEERVRAAAQRAGAAARRTRRDPVRAHVREAGHSHYRGQFPAGQRAGGTRAWHASGSAGEEVAAGRDRQLRAGQRVSGRALSSAPRPDGAGAPVKAAALMSFGTAPGMLV